MSEHVVRGLIEAVNAGDFDAAVGHLSEDVVLVLRGEAATLAGSGESGKAAVARWFADWFRTFEPGYRFEFGEVRADGDLVHAEITHHARGRASGADVTMSSSWVYTVRDGLIVSLEAS